MTVATQMILGKLLQDPTRQVYGLELCHGLGLPSGTVHPILARLERVGWVASAWENVDVSSVGRPRRRYYHLTRDGQAEASSALARASRPRLPMFEASPVNVLEAVR